MRIDIVSDVVCPWCIIGYKQLEHALDETGIEAVIHWHPFELNPHMGDDGETLGSTWRPSTAPRWKIQSARGPA